jgi:hypothetical protein
MGSLLFICFSLYFLLSWMYQSVHLRVQLELVSSSINFKFIYIHLIFIYNYRETKKLNQALFGGVMVIGSVGTSISINTDLIQSAPGYNNQQYHQQFQQPVIAYAGAPAVAAPVQYAAAPVQYAAAQPVVVTPVANNDMNKNVAPAPVGVAAAPMGVIQHNPVAQPTSNTMSVQLPANAHPGMVLTVAAPTGVMVQVTVQAHHRPGEVILVNY